MANGKDAERAWLGVDVGGTKILAGVFNANLERMARVKIDAKARAGSEEVIGRIVKGAREAVDKAGLTWKQIRAAGVGAPSPIEPSSGEVIFAPNLDWRGVPLQKILRDQLKTPVFVENDCNLATLGIHEVEFKGKPRNLLGIFVGTGIGGGLILNGELFTGFNGAAGEFGHMTMNCGGGMGPDNIPGSLESIASRSALTRQIREAVENGTPTLLTEIVGPDLKEIKSGQIRKAIERGDTFVESLVGRSAEYVGAAIGTLINIINPEVVALGGGLLEQLAKRLMPIIRTKALEYSDSGVNKGIRIVASTLADDAGIVGAAAFARRSVKG